MVNIGLELFTFDPQVEEQEWPVTPYQIKVYTLPHCPLSFFSVYVDGVKVGKKVLKHGKDWWVRPKIDAQYSLSLHYHFCTLAIVCSERFFSR